VTSASTAVNAGAAASKTTPPEVPFRGTFAGHLTASTPIDPPLLSNLIEASGQSSQLGQFALEIPHVVNAMTREAMGSYEFTAANGDGLTATFTGLGTVVAPGVVSAGYGDGDRGHGSIRGRNGKLHRRTDIHVRDGRGYRSLRGGDYAGECEPAVRSANGGF
jgi:hypothetical protein